MLKAILYLYFAGMIVYGAFTFGPQLASSRCESKWSGAHLPSEYHWGLGCMVFVNGAWVPEANVQFRPNSN